MSTDTDAMVAWLDALRDTRSADCSELTEDLLRRVGYPPIPVKGTDFMSMERYWTFVHAGKIASDTYCNDAVREKMKADARGDFRASEAAVSLVQFWADVNEWIGRTFG